MVTMSETETNNTKATRLESGTDLPRMTASNADAGMPSKELRRSARMTWSRHAARAATLRELSLTRAISGARRHPLTGGDGLGFVTAVGYGPDGPIAVFE